MTIQSRFPPNVKTSALQTVALRILGLTTMPYNSRYRRTSNFTSGHSGYDDPNDKEAPAWKIFLIVLSMIAGGFGLLVGIVAFFSYLFN